MDKKKFSLALAPVISLRPAIGLPIICESVLFEPRRGVMREHEIYHNVEFGITNEEKIKSLVKELNRALGTNIGVPDKWGESTLFSMGGEDWRGWGKIIFIRNPSNPKTGFLKFETTVCSPHEYVAQMMRKVLETFRTKREKVEEHRTKDGQGIKLRRGLGEGFDDASVMWMRKILGCRQRKSTGGKLKALRRTKLQNRAKRAKK